MQDNVKALFHMTPAQMFNDHYITAWGVQNTGILRYFFRVVRTAVHLPVPRYSDDSIFSNSLL